MRVCHLLLLSLASVLVTADKNYDGYALLQVTPTTQQQLHFLKQVQETGDYDFWRSILLDKPTEILVSEDARTLHDDLESEGFVVHTSIPDVGRLIHEQGFKREQNKDSRMFYDTYHTLDEINQWVEDMEATYTSDLVHGFTLGQTYEGRDIKALHIMAGESAKPEAFYFDGAIHGREWVASSTVMYIAEQLLSNYGNDTLVTTLIDAMDFYVVPVSNPDGYEWTWTGDDRMWRKTRSPNAGSTCMGTDPNRNFDIAWSTAGSSSDPCEDKYHGSAAASEVEVRNITDWIADHPQLVAFLAYHSYGQQYHTPYAYVNVTAPDYNELMTICLEAIDAVRDVHGFEYTCDAFADLHGENSGNAFDYAYDVNIKYSYTLRVRDTGEYGILLPEEQILPNCEENYAGFLVFAESVMEAIGGAE